MVTDAEGASVMNPGEWPKTTENILWILSLISVVWLGIVFRVPALKRRFRQYPASLAVAIPVLIIAAFGIVSILEEPTRVFRILHLSR